MPLLLPLAGGAGSPASMPSRVLEIAFDSDPSETPIWTDVTEFARRIDITRGKSREADRYQAGHMTATLDNRDRRFDPSNDKNRLSVDGASFETSTGGWTVLTGATIARSTAQALDGVASLGVTATSVLEAAAQSELVNCVEGLTYTAIASLRAATTGRDFDVILRFYDEGGTQLQQTVGSDTDTTAGWTTAIATGVAPPGAFGMRVIVSINLPLVGEVHYIDEAGLLFGTTTWQIPSPYSGKVLPMRRIRLRADGQTQFDGYVDSWDMEFDNPNEARTIVSATDAFKVLVAGKLKSSVYTQEVSGDSPIAWFRLGEPVGSTTVTDSVAAIPGTVSGTATFGQTGLAGDDDTAVTMANANSGIRVTDFRAFIEGTGQSFSFEALIDTAESATEVIMQQDGTNSCQIRLRMLGSGVLESQITDIGSAYTAETESTGTVNNGATHHVVATYSVANGLRVWVDGVNDSNVVLTDTGSPVVDGFQLTLANDKSFLVNGWNGVLDEVAIYDRELTSTEIAAHASAALEPWEGDLPGVRFNRVLDAIEFPAFLRSIDTGTTALIAADLDDTALNHLQKVTDTEFGEFYADRDGLVVFNERNALINQDSAGTFGEGAGDLQYSEIELDYSDQLIRNDVTVNRVDGVAQTVKSAASIATLLTHSYERLGLLHDSDTHSRNAAEFLVSEYAQPLLRVTRIRILPQRDPDALFPVVLARELGDKIVIHHTPPGGGDDIEQDVRIEGISHRITAEVWETTWQLTSGAGAATCFFELDDGAGSAPCGLDDAALYF